MSEKENKRISFSDMKINSWNVIGINASNQRCRIKQLIDSMNGDIILLQETKLFDDSFDKTLTKWPKQSSLHSPRIGTSSHLVVPWNPQTIQGQLIQQHFNWKILKMSHFDLSFIIINVYGPSATQDKLKVWNSITHLIQTDDSQNDILREISMQF